MCVCVPQFPAAVERVFGRSQQHVPFIYSRRGRLAGWLRDGLARFAVKGVDPKKKETRVREGLKIRARVWGHWELRSRSSRPPASDGLKVAKVRGFGSIIAQWVDVIQFSGGAVRVL